ncbi:hypothetical protein AUP68_14057 [Ilyonectria robusta]
MWMEHAGFPASKKQVEEAANTLRLQRDPKATPLSKTWYAGLRKDHPQLRRTFLKAIEKSRKSFEAFDITDITTFYKELEDLVKTHRIGPSETWNEDEAGLRIACLRETVEVLVARSLWNVPPSSTPLPPTWSPHTCDLQQASTPTSIGRQASEMNYKAGAQNSQNSGPETPLAQRSGRIRPIRIALSNGRKTLICSRPLFQSRGSYSTTMIPGGMRRTKDPFSAKRRRFRPPHSRFSRGNDWPSHRLRRTQLERKRDPAWSLVRQLRRRIQGPRSFRRRRLPRLSSTRHETSIPAPSPDGRHIASRLPRWNHQGISLR